MRFSLSNTLGTTMLGSTLGLALSSFATALALPATDKRQSEPRPTAYVAAPDGTVYGWHPDRGSLEAATLPWPKIAGLSQVEQGGPLVVLLPPSSEPRGRRERQVLGHVALLDASRSYPTLQREIHIACEGRQVVLSRGGSHAYVLGRSRMPARGGGAPQDAILEIGLAMGRILATVYLPEPSAGMALDPAGNRLYVSQPGKIATFTTVPLANSWLLRSPGENGALYVGREGAILAALRGPVVALFDPKALSALPTEERRARIDDATVVLRLPFAPQGLALSADGRDALAWHPGSRPVWIDLDAAAAAGQPEGLGVLPEGASLQTLPGGEGADSLHLALFPDLKVVTLPLPPPLPREEPTATPGPTPTPGASPVPGPTPAHAPSPAPGPMLAPAPSPASSATPAPSSAPTPTPSSGPMAAPSASPAPPAPASAPPVPASAAPMPAPAAPVATSEKVLRGRLYGRLDRVEAIVIYGPGSIVREQARVRPAADGTWEAPLPPPGTYRILPLGPGARPVHSVPTFHTLTVAESGGQSGIDFRVE